MARGTTGQSDEELFFAGSVAAAVYSGCLRAFSTWPRLLRLVRVSEWSGPNTRVLISRTTRGSVQLTVQSRLIHQGTLRMGDILFAGPNPFGR